MADSHTRLVEESVERKRHNGGTRNGSRSMSLISELAGNEDREINAEIREQKCLVKKLVKENEELKAKAEAKEIELHEHIRCLEEKNEELKEEKRRLEEKENEKSRWQQDRIRLLEEQKEELMEECRRLENRTQNDENLRHLNDYAEEMKEKVESLQMYKQLSQNIWKKALKDQRRKNASLQVEKENVVRILKRQSEVYQRDLGCFKRKVKNLEEQLEVNSVAYAACIEMGYNHDMVMAARLEWEKRHACKAADLVAILMEDEYGWNVTQEGPDVSEEGQNLGEAGQIEQLEGAVGGQDLSGVRMDLLKDVYANESNTEIARDNGIVAPSGCPYRGQS